MARTKYYHTDEAAKLLGISVAEVCRRLNDGLMKGYRAKRRWMVNMEQECFEAFVKKKKQQTASSSHKASKRKMYYHVDELASLYKVSESRVRDLLKAGYLQGHKRSRKWLINSDQIAAFEEFLVDYHPTSITEVEDTVVDVNLDDFYVYADRHGLKLDEDWTRALQWILNGRNVFITGKAGTGKTELLKMLRKVIEHKKAAVVVAPTGVAALHAQGVTMHSFFRIPLVPYIAGHKMNDLFSLSDSAAKVMEALDMIILDEVSMVRCDVMDAMDAILRHYRNSKEPFGGVQMVMFGDLYQLMPVAPQEEWKELRKYYNTPYFFSCSALERAKYYVCKLEKIHRQEVSPFLDALNHIRVGEIELKDLNLINLRHKPCYKVGVKENIVTLMTHNWQVKKHNNSKLEELSGYPYVFDAKYSNWYEKEPADFHLRIKKGARVMFLKNNMDDSHCVNGTMGWVNDVIGDAIYVTIDGDDNPTRVEPQKWDSYDYKIDPKTKTIQYIPVGYFIQYPLKLAWAVTVHKCQGLTFDKVVMDISDSFTYGQVYVALSRCRTLEGIILLRRIVSHKIVADDKIEDYNNCIDENGMVGELPSYCYDLKDITMENTVFIVLDEKRFLNVKNGTTRKVTKTIMSDIDAEIIFEYEQEKLMVNPTFKEIKREWKYTDMNGGDCPFVLKKKKYALISHDGENMIFSLDDQIQIDPNAKRDKWNYTVYLGERLQ